MSRIFVSYSRVSRDLANGIVGDLEQLGNAAWLDEKLTGGNGLRFQSVAATHLANFSAGE
jgi:hypothetical protein